MTDPVVRLMATERAGERRWIASFRLDGGELRTALYSDVDGKPDRLIAQGGELVDDGRPESEQLDDAMLRFAARIYQAEDDAAAKAARVSLGPRSIDPRPRKRRRR